MKFGRAIAMLAAVVLGAAQAPVMAQGSGSKPVRIVVPFPPGGPTDILGRIVAAKLQEVTGQTVIVENKPGASTMLGTQAVASSVPDGTTLGLVITSHVLNPNLRATMPYDTLKDLSGVTQISAAHLVFVATPKLPANNMAELIALAKAQPGKLSYGDIVGIGSAPHLAGELLKNMAGIDMLHVPYKGSGSAQQDLIAGRLSVVIDVLHTAVPQVKAGRLKILGVTSAQRAALAPEYPTVAETLPGYSVPSWFGFVVPSATPRDVVKRLNADILKALKSPDTNERIRSLGMEVVGSTPEEFDAFIRTEMAKYVPVIKAANIKLE
jgi:tripartite-type tricarboxylate transporter receptor subunit TctC